VEYRGVLPRVFFFCLGCSFFFGGPSISLDLFFITALQRLSNELLTLLLRRSASFPRSRASYPFPFLPMRDLADPNCCSVERFFFYEHFMRRLKSSNDPKCGPFMPVLLSCGSGLGEFYPRNFFLSTSNSMARLSNIGKAPLSPYGRLGLAYDPF